MYSKGKYIIFQSLLMLISPLAGFLVALRFYKNSLSMVFMLIFAVYFGYHFYIGEDLAYHYIDMRMHYAGRSLKDILIDPRVLNAENDYYHMVLKYLISRVSLSRELFGAVNCILYSAAFLFFIRQFKEYYKQFMPITCGLLFLSIVFTVEFYWYQGVRFWIGVFVFAGFYLKYVNTGNKLYLLLSTSCALFHYTLINLLFIFIVDWILDKFWYGFRFILLAISFVFRFISFDFLPILAKKIPGLDLGARTVSWIHESMMRRIEDLRENANIFYSMRMDLMLIIGILILMIMWSRKVVFTKKHLMLFFYALTVYTFINFGYAELILYIRFYRIAILIFYSFLFVVAFDNYEKIKGVSLIIMILAFIPAFYALLTQVIEMRAHLFNSELFFGNFFIDWNGGMTTGRGKWYID